MKGASLRLIAPYAAWMVLMMALPSAPWAYAVRTAVTLALLVTSWTCSRVARGTMGDGSRVARGTMVSLASGLLVGLLVLVIWIAPDQLAWYRKFCVIGDPYSAPAPYDLATAAPLTYAFLVIQLFGSAFVISAAEELFFRKWLIGYAGFGWMVALFAIEHNRPVVAAICGVLYGVLYLRKGLFSAIVAHATTNLGLGVFVLLTNRWEFW